MIKILIIEDELPASQLLIKAIKEFDDKINICGVLASIRESIIWLNSNTSPDLILLDIHLADGISLEIFRQCKISAPVIFTTAYDEYILDSFHFNGIDYLLKPVKQEKLHQALTKYLKLQHHFTKSWSSFIDKFDHQITVPKKRYVVKKGIEFVSLKTDDIAFFFTEHKMVFVYTFNADKFILEKTLSDLEGELDPQQYFRLNRKYIANIEAIKKFKPFDKGKILIELNPAVNEEVIVSQEKSSDFKMWMER